MTTEGVHYGTTVIDDLFHCRCLPQDPEEMLVIMREAAKVAGVKVVEEGAQPLKHEFSPQGLTATLQLSESHLTVHVHGWPERGYIRVDISTCGKKADPIKAADYLRGVFQPDLNCSKRNVLEHIGPG
ncbi:adenosylmethionine decarboxylase [Patescibacteria group bacterium]|nr:adenosylmethionine decarboxylase [Patescibacteria group bacterium]